MSVNLLLVRHADVNDHRNPIRACSLIPACVSGRNVRGRRRKNLLEKGANMEWRSTRDVSDLDCAACYVHLELTKLVLEARASQSGGRTNGRHCIASPSCREGPTSPASGELCARVEQNYYSIPAPALDFGCPAHRLGTKRTMHSSCAKCMVPLGCCACSAGIGR